MKTPRTLTALLILVTIVLLQPVLHAEDPNEGKKLYQTYCTGCHGSSGKGDGPAAKTLPVKPADHTRAEMSKYTDQYLFEIISKGGSSLGKSAQMPAWGGLIKDPHIFEIVGYIRTLSRQEKKADNASEAQNKPRDQR